MCLCGLLPGFETQTELHVLQHRRERKHAFGTVRLLNIGVENLRIYDSTGSRGQVGSIPMGFPRDAGILYPGPGSVDLLQLVPRERPRKLVVIDGTWNQAHCMFRDNPWLHGLPRYSLQPAEPSRYRIRKEPRAECLSTLESVVMALKFLEPETPGIASLLTAFDQMNERQVQRVQVSRSAERRIKRPRLRKGRAVPDRLTTDPSRIVIVYAESGNSDERRNKSAREIVQWSGLRWSEPDTCFDRIIRTQAPMPSGRFRDHLAWGPDDIASAKAFAEVAREWGQFIRKDDVIVAWNKSTLRLGTRVGFVTDGIMLKAVYGNTTKRIFGTLDDVVSAHSLTPIQVKTIRGRASERLGNAHAVTSHLMEWARHQRQHG